MAKGKSPQGKEEKKEKKAAPDARLVKRIVVLEAKLDLTANLLAEVIGRIKSAKSLKGL